MGIYDIYGNAQIKIGDVKMNIYEIGDSVLLDDGIYIDHSVAIVVLNGIFVAQFDKLYTKWGDEMTPEQILCPYDEVSQVVKDLKEKNLD